MKKTSIALLIALIIVSVVTLYVTETKTTTPKAGDNTSSYVYYGLGSSTGVICGTSTTQLVASSTGSRVSLKIYNDSATALYLGLGVPAVLHQGIAVPASIGSVVSLDSPIYFGAVNCISSSATASTTIEELK